MRVRGSWVCAVTVVGAAAFAGCSSPTAVTKYDAASQCEEKADKTSDLQAKAKCYTDAIAKYNEFIVQNQLAYKDLVPYAAYKIALCYRGLGKKAEAMTAYDEVMNKYPGTKPAEWSRAERSELDKIMDMKPLPAPMMMPAKSAPMTPAKPAPAMTPSK